MEKGELYLDDVIKQPSLIHNARLRDRSSSKLSEYEIPVQKAVESIIRDVYNSNSDKSLLEFLEELKAKENNRFISFK